MTLVKLEDRGQRIRSTNHEAPSNILCVGGFCDDLTR